MTLVRWEPRSRNGLRGEIDQLFDRFRRQSFTDEELPATVWYPTADVAEREDAYTVTLDLPGMAREDIKLRIADNVLTVSGERKVEHEESTAGGNYHRVERSYGGFTRSFILPSAVDEGKVAATYKDGVLAITLPKSEDAKPRQIAVN